MHTCRTTFMKFGRKVGAKHCSKYNNKIWRHSENLNKGNNEYGIFILIILYFKQEENQLLL
jgi:hypothetical protein